jgi:type I restriction enzyme S subunit
VSRPQTLSISDFCRTGSGGTPSRAEFGRYYDGGTIPWVKSGELREGIIVDTEEYVTPVALKESSIKLVPKGAILLAMYGATVGRMALLGVEATTNQAVCHIVPDPGIANTGYLFHALSAQVPSIVAKGVGGAQPNISQGVVKSLKVWLPSLQEQRRIAAILDQADALRAQRREALAQLDSITQAIFIEMFGDPVSNPMAWAKAPLTEVCHCYSGGTPSKAKPELWVGELPWFSAKDLKKDDLFDAQDHIAESVTETTTLKKLPPDTVVIVVRGMILAHTFPVSVIRVHSAINQDLKALLPRIPIEAQFLASCLRAQSGFVLEKVSEAGHGTKRLDTLGLQEIAVLLPPDQLQQTFATRIQAVEALKATHRTTLAELDALFASLQHRAFTGAL